MELRGRDPYTPAMASPVPCVGSRAFGRRSEAGQGLAEYALMIGLVAVVAIVALMFMGNEISGTIAAVGAAL